MIRDHGWSKIRSSVIATDVKVQQSRRYVVARNIDAALALRGGDIPADTSDFPVLHSNIHRLVDPVRHIDNVPPLEEKVVPGSSLGKSR